MHENTHNSMENFAPSLSGLSQRDWLNRLSAVAQDNGYFQPLGRAHFAAFVENTDTLIVTFETMQGIRALDANAHPIGWNIVRELGWSHLGLVSAGDTWFRDAPIFEYFDTLVDEGIFDEFERVIFYGAGPCAYAACAFSVAAPGAQVVAIQPQATLDPALTGWDDRFRDQRKRDFSSRYAFAPDMIEAAEHAYIIYDPRVSLDAMHAALFHGPNVMRLPVPHMGEAIQSQFLAMNVLTPLLRHVGTGSLTRAQFFQLMRARRDHPAYLRNVLAALERDARDELVEMLCYNVTGRMDAPKFERRLRKIEDYPPLESMRG